MILTIKDRIVMPELFPERGGMLEMIIVKSIADKVALTSKEITDFSIVQEGDSIKWNQSKDTGVEIEFEKSEIELLKKQVQEMDDNKNITMRTFDLCMKIKGS
ncbi:MAG: hypothetical protein EGP82_00170 [Odoribacter splanchnicus]|nr:hypothetical protein [Odoribacter splanchnicus]